MSSGTHAMGWRSLFSAFDAGAIFSPSRNPPDDSCSIGSNHTSSEIQAQSAPDSIVANRAEIDSVPVSQLLTRIREGDQTALGIVYDAWYDPLWRLAIILTRSPDTADEVLHSVFLTLWTRRQTLPDVADLRAYLNSAIRNAVRMLHRHIRVADQLAGAVTATGGDVPAMGQHLPGPDEATESNEFFAAYRATLSTLSDRERIAVQLRYEEDLSYDEIGHLLGVSKVGAYKIVQRAESKVRALLSKFRPG